MIIEVSLRFQNVGAGMQSVVGIDGHTVNTLQSDGSAHQIKTFLHDTDSTAWHTLSITLQGKDQSHTILDQTGAIVSDCALIVDFVCINDINVSELFLQGQQCYIHDHNGRSTTCQDEFYGYMGYNGTVLIEFSTPIHLWFLTQCQ